MQEHSLLQLVMKLSQTRARSPRRRQAGAALLTAMIIVTLIATLAAAMVWQQWRAVQVEAAERERSQAGWILSGALEFARLILREDLRSGRPTALSEPWATPLAEARLSTFLAVDKGGANDGPEAFLSGSIVDAQSRFNLTNLVAGNKIDPAELQSLERLCVSAGVDRSMATRLATGLRDANVAAVAGSRRNASAPLLPRTVPQLVWLGIDPASLQPLVPYIVILPTPTDVNVNTAPPEVLVAVIKGLDMAGADRLVHVRQRTPFKDLAAVTAQSAVVVPLPVRLGVRSSYFEVRSRLRLADKVLVQSSLMRRFADGKVDVLFQQRQAAVDHPG